MLYDSLYEKILYRITKYFVKYGNFRSRLIKHYDFMKESWKTHENKKRSATSRNVKGFFLKEQPTFFRMLHSPHNNLNALTRHSFFVA